MEAAYLDTSRVAIGPADRRAWPALRSLCAAVVRAVAANARDDSLDRVFSAPSAGFGALSRNEKNRLLDRGFRP